MRLVGVTQVKGQRRPVDRLAAIGPQRRLVQPGPAHYPLGTHAHVVTEQPLQAPHRQAGHERKLVDPPQRRIRGDQRDQISDLRSHRILFRQAGEQQRLGATDHLGVAQVGHDRHAGLLRQRPEHQDTRHHPVAELRDRRSPERPEAPRPEPNPQRLPQPRQPTHEQGTVHAVDPGAGRLEDQVHVGMRQDRLLVGRLPAQVPADDPVVVDEARERTRRLDPHQAEPVRRETSPEHPPPHRRHVTSVAVAFLQDRATRP